MHFNKMVQFSLLVKAGDRLREFNFKKMRHPDEELFAVNVCDERGERIFFNMQKKEANWKIVPASLPGWVSQYENNLQQAIEKELVNWA